MDKDRVTGKKDELAGMAKQKVGELTGNTHRQIDGVSQRVKGKLESAWGQAKDAVRDARRRSASAPGPKCLARSRSWNSALAWCRGCCVSLRAKALPGKSFRRWP